MLFAQKGNLPLTSSYLGLFPPIGKVNDGQIRVVNALPDNVIEDGLNSGSRFYYFPKNAPDILPMQDKTHDAPAM